MGKKSLSQAKNDIRSCFMEIVDPSPSSAEVDRLWTSFDSQCAYCGKLLTRESREGHLDHLDAKDTGLNHVSNRVLACAVCNGDEKRETDWRKFIASKGTTDEVEPRIKKIEMWVRNEALSPDIAKRIHQMRERAAELSEQVCAEMNKAATTLRELRNKVNRPG